MSGIGGNEPTGYNYGVADRLKSAASTLQSKLYGQAGSRSSVVRLAMQEFSGYYSEVFERNGEVASEGRREIADALVDLSRFVGELKEAAQQEDQRREDARAWEQRQREREDNFFKGATHEVGSWFGLSDDPKPPDPEPAPELVTSSVTVSGREIPAPTGSSSTSSAVPEDLNHFKTRTGELDDDIDPSFRTLENALGDYENYCNARWGSLDGQPVVTALRNWLEANAEDAQWAGLVADAFEAAGGSGSITMADSAIEATLASAGVDAHRDDLTIEPFSAIGTPPTNGFADDPVNTSTGNFLEPETDMSFFGAAASLQFTRMYNSMDDRAGVFGHGWSSILDTRLVFDDEGAYFTMADGRLIIFPRAGDGWDRGVGENYWLIEVAAAQFRSLRFQRSYDRVLVVRDNVGGWWAFSPAGTWLGNGTGTGTAVTVIREADGQIVRLEHEHGRFITVEYTDNRVVSIHASDGRRLEYHYDHQRRLTGVTDPVGTRTYRWNAAGLIDRAVAADGVVECENFYDDQHRVIRQLTPYGRSVRFAYLRGRVTAVSTDDGTGANTWIADRKGRVVGIIDADGNRQTMAYDPHGNIVSATDRDGHVTVHAYDQRGRKTRTVTPEGADITYGYDDHDRVTTVVTASGGVVEYEYADRHDRNPSIMIDSVGGRTEMTWQHGLLHRIVDPEGVPLYMTYDRHGDLIAVANAEGNTARLVRDQAGRVIETITPLGITSRYHYNDRGLLGSVEDPNGSIWRFKHGPGGKISAAIDPTGARTEFAYGPHGELVCVTDPLGRTMTKDFDEYGNVATVGLPDGAEWCFTHDAVSRLREMVDPAGGVWRRDYDVNGQLSTSIDPTGVRADAAQTRVDGIATVMSAFEQTTVDADEYGRPIRVAQTDGSEELMSYDAAGRPIELVDANGGLTQLTRDLAGRVTAITTPAGRTTHYEYDVCGRPAVAIGPTGGRTVLAYDADSRVIASTNPAGETTTIDYDWSGRVIREQTPGGLCARYRYNKLGRLVATQDSRYGQRAFSYDAAGQLVKAINGLGGVTRYEYDLRGRLVKTIDPQGAITTRTYTELDQIASSIDPLGRVTTATYDPAGRQLSQTDPDGNVTEFHYDTAGRYTGVTVNGRHIATVDRDLQKRTTTVTDGTHTAAKVTHTLTFDRLHRLIQRDTRINDDVETTRWDYDADGGRTGFTDAAGHHVAYHRDMVGRVTRITHSELGDIQLAYDAAGRLREARTEDHVQTWEYTNGYPVVHTRVDASGVEVTHMTRDAQGRITKLEGPEGTTTYDYDDACQLISITGSTTQQLTYDETGRLIAETTPAGQRTLRYDAAGQLLTTVEADGTQTTYDYDGRGRRLQSTTAAQSTEYTWSDHGWLTTITEHDAENVATTNLWVNAMGELAEVNGTALHWDGAAGVPQLAGIGDIPVFQGPAGLTGIGTRWQTPGWRDARSTDVEDPWQILAGAQRAQAELPAGVGLTPDGGLHVAGLEWMGARVYDAAARGFLSVDPLAPPPGVVWGNNPYSYAGNDPLHAVDPHGLAPITDEELQSYSDGLQGPLASAAGTAWDWTKNNWEYIAAGAAVVGGVAVMATGVGGPLGAAMISGALMSGGLSIGTQKHANGSVDWGQVGTEAAIGGVIGGAGTGAANMTTSMLLRQSSSVRSAATTHASRATVQKADDGVMAMLNGRTRLAEAAKIEARTNNNMMVDNYMRNVAGDAVSNMTTANAEYAVDVATDPDKDLTMEGLMMANGEGAFDTLTSTSGSFINDGLSMSNAMSSSPSTPGNFTTFARQFGTDLAADTTSSFVGSQMQDAVYGDVSNEDRVSDSVESTAESLGSNMNDNFPNLHTGK